MGPTRVALILKMRREDSFGIYDQHRLLADYKSDVAAHLVDGGPWEEQIAQVTDESGFFIKSWRHPREHGLVAVSLCSSPVHYQMWLAERRPSACPQRLIEFWLVHAAYLLSYECLNLERLSLSAPSLANALQSFAPEAISRYLQSELDLAGQTGIRNRVDAIVDAISGISTAREEGRRATGCLVLLDSQHLPELDLIAEFPPAGAPRIHDYKHVTKLLSIVQDQDACLVSEGQKIIGVAGRHQKHLTPAMLVDFWNGRGEVFIGSTAVCTVSDGRFYGLQVETNLESLEEILEEWVPRYQARKDLRRIIAFILNDSVRYRHGCTVVIDMKDPPTRLSGQRLARPVDLALPENLRLAQSMSRVDGALHLDPAGRLHAFGCILDGQAITGEERSRGARYNCARRFSHERRNIAVVVISEDGHLSVFSGGRELVASRALPPVDKRGFGPISLEEWLQDG